MKKIIVLFLLLTSLSTVYSQNNGFKNFHATLNYNSIYKIDFDINEWYFQMYNSTNVIFDIDENGSGRIILYYPKKNIFYIESNYRVNYSDGSGTYFFKLYNGNLLRLGVTPDNIISTFSIVGKNNIGISFVNK